MKTVLTTSVSSMSPEGSPNKSKDHLPIMGTRIDETGRPDTGVLRMFRIEEAYEQLSRVDEEGKFQERQVEWVRRRFRSRRNESQSQLPRSTPTASNGVRPFSSTRQESVNRLNR